MARKIVLFFIMFFIIVTPTFAGEFNFIEEKEVYKELGILLSTQTKYSTISALRKPYFYTDAFITQAFNIFSDKLSQSSYTQDMYPYTMVEFGDSYVSFSVASDVDINQFSCKEINFAYLTFGVDSNGQITEVRELKYYSGSFLRDISLQSTDGDVFSRKAFLLSVSKSPSTLTYVSSNLPLYCAFQRSEITYSSSNVGVLDKSTLTNNFVLNKEYEVGKNNNFSINYYYYDSDNRKISVTDKISNNVLSEWWGYSAQPYIDYSLISDLPNGDYYCDYTWSCKYQSSNTFTKTETQKVFTVVSQSVTPPTPSGDTPSGDFPNYNDKLDNISGLVSDTNNKLDGISGEIGQTNNKLDGISGELGEINDNLTTVPDLSGTTITSGDIESALNFDFVDDPYSNFWLELTTGLSSALTGSNRTINISFRDKNYAINLDYFSLQVPNVLKPFLTIISTVFIIWKLVKYIKITIDKISSGNIDNVLAMNEEERNS